MALKHLASAGADFARAITAVAQSRKPLIVNCSTYGEEINLAIRLRSYLKLLRDTPMASVPLGHQPAKQALENLGWITVTGGSRQKNKLPPFVVTIQPMDFEASALGRALAEIETPETTVPPIEPPIEPSVDSSVKPPRGLSDSEILYAFQEADRVAIGLMTPAQRARGEALMLGTSIDPDRRT
jgi:hypothetical protein